MQAMKQAAQQLEKPEVRDFFEKESRRERKADKVLASVRKRNQRNALSNRLKKVRQNETQAQQVLAKKSATGII